MGTTDRDELGIRAESSALRQGLGISFAFPYGSDAWHGAADWSRPDAHTTSLEELPGNRICRRWLIHRDLDSSGYQVAVTGAGMELKGP